VKQITRRALLVERAQMRATRGKRDKLNRSESDPAGDLHSHRLQSAPPHGIGVIRTYQTRGGIAICMLQ